MMPIVASANTDTDSKFNVIYKQNQYQQKSQSSWPDLKLDPGQKTDVDIIILNRDENTAHFKITPAQATTNSNMGYTLDVPIENAKSQIEENQYFADIISIDNTEITIPAKSKVTIPIHIYMPKSTLIGNWFGGVNISKTTVNKSKSGMTNNFEYNQVVMLSNSGTMQKPDLKLNSLKYQIDKIRSDYLQFNLTNFSEGYMSHATTAIQIYTKSGHTVGSVIKSDNHAIANGNTFHYNVPISQNLKPGKYVADFKIIDKTNNKIWHWNPEFTVSDAQFVAKSTSNWLWLIILIIILVVLLFLWIILYKKSEIVRVILLEESNFVEKDIKYQSYKKLVKDNVTVKLIKRHVK